jgi:hypothetical protein
VRRLMDHDARVGQRPPLARRTRREEDGGHGLGVTHADRVHGGLSSPNTYVAGHKCASPVYTVSKHLLHKTLNPNNPTTNIRSTITNPIEQARV